MDEASQRFPNRPILFFLLTPLLPMPVSSHRGKRDCAVPCRGFKIPSNYSAYLISDRTLRTVLDHDGWYKGVTCRLSGNVKEKRAFSRTRGGSVDNHWPAGVYCTRREGSHDEVNL